MKKKSFWLVIGLLVASLAFVLTGCRKKKNDPVSYTLSETEIVLTVGESKTLTITPAPEVSVSWQTGDAGIATVENGTVTAVAEGTVTVTATVENGEAPLTCSVTVNKKPEPKPPVGGGVLIGLHHACVKDG